MNIGLSTASFYPQKNTEDTLDDIKSLGINIIEVFLQTESEYKPQFIDLLRGKIETCGVKVFSVHASSAQFEPLLFSKYKREVLDSKDTFKRIFEGCQALGAKYYVFHGPRMMSFAKEDWAGIVERMDELIQLAKQYNITIAQENVSWCVSGNLDFIKYLKANLENIYFTFDNKQAHKSGVDPVELIHLMGERLVNVHISDIKGKEVGIFPGSGEYDFRRLLDKLRDIKYGGPIFIEVYGKYLPMNLKIEFDFFKNKFF